MMKSWRAWSIGLVIGAPTTAAAVDGAIEINHACAVAASGCVSGAAAGYPVQISSRGNYRLTSDLNVPAGVDGIAVGANLVTVDLNGFTILGPVLCSNTSTCTGGGGAGQGVAAANTYGVSVVDGRIEGFSTRGVSLGAAGRVELVYVAGIGDPSVPSFAMGIEVNEGSFVERVEVQVVRGIGITAPSSRVFDSVTRDILVTGVTGATSSPVAVHGLYIFRVGQTLAHTAQIGPSYCGAALC